MSYEVHLSTWRFAYDTKQNSRDRPRFERRQEINARPESGGYPKGDAEVDTEFDSDFHQALTQGVDGRIRDSEHVPEHDSEYERIKQSSNERGSAERLNVPLRRLIVGTEHLGQVFLIKKWHKYVKHLNFEIVSHQLVSLREQLARINPKEEGELEKVFGKKDSYLLTNTRASYGQTR